MSALFQISASSIIAFLLYFFIPGLFASNKTETVYMKLQASVFKQLHLKLKLKRT